MMKVAVVSSIGAQTYAEKHDASPAQWRALWQHAVFRGGDPQDVVDFYHLRRESSPSTSEVRHVYVNGIVIGNRLRHAGFGVELYNTWPDTTQQIESLSGADAVFLSTTYVTAAWEDSLADHLAFLRKKNPEMLLVVGGAGAYRLAHGGEGPMRRLHNLIGAGADVVIASRDGLETAIQVLRSSPARLGQIIVDSSEYELCPTDYDLDPWPDSFHSSHTALMTAQGCPFSCSFCSYKSLLGSPRYFQLSAVSASIRAAIQSRRRDLRCLRIVDECFNVPEERAKTICGHLTEIAADMSWCCFLRGDRITPQLARELAASGCRLASMGVESGSPKMQRLMNKNLDLTKVSKGIELLRRNGIQSVISLLVGFYGEAEETVKETMDFVQTAQPDLARINVWSPSVGEERSLLGKEHLFVTGSNGWSHASLSEEDACALALRFYEADLGVVFLPPFSSIFDQWPQLIGNGLAPEEVLRLFREYNRVARRGTELRQAEASE